MKKILLVAIILTAFSCKERSYNPERDRSSDESEPIEARYGTREEGEIKVIETKRINRIGAISLIEVDGERFLLSEEGYIQPLKK